MANKENPKYIVRFAQAGRRPPIINLRSPALNKNRGRFYIDTGADVSLIKRCCIKKDVEVDKYSKVSISGITPGECVTLGRTNISLNGLSCEAHIVPDDFPIDTDGLLGWDMLTRHKGRINAANRCLELGQSVVPFEKDEEFVIPPKTTSYLCTCSEHG